MSKSISRIAVRTAAIALALMLVAGSIWPYLRLRRLQHFFTDNTVQHELFVIVLICLGLAFVMSIVLESVRRPRPPITIAVDGTAASGKGTLARKLAVHFGFHHLDSGSLYRLAALGVLEAKGDPANEADALAAARAVDPARADDPAIRTAEMGNAASIVSAYPSVRSALLEFQREFAKRSPGAVIDGRDIGTVVCPGATVKLFVDAAPEVRARRRWLELSAAGNAPAESEILADIKARDERDRNRAVAPLKPAPDAKLLDTSDLDIEAAFAAALALVSTAVEAATKA
jgi:CMP/dCMP kinase